MISANQRSALAALDVARPIIARLDRSGHPEDLAADLIESWSAVETALRSLVGGSAHGGQALIGDLRQRNLLNINQAHALLEYLAARDRASRPDYRPDDADVAAARAGFQTLEAALGAGIGADTAMFQAVGPGSRTGPEAAVGFGAPVPPPPGRSAAAAAAEPAVPSYGDDSATRRSGRQPWFFPVILLLGALVAIGGAAFVLYSGRAGDRALARGVAAYTAGRREVARREFEEAARRSPKSADPQVYLARLAREDGDLPRAQRALDSAVRLEPNNHKALREMGQLTLQAGRPDLAVRFFERAIRSNPRDSASMGWMGCALVRQGRPDLAQSWFSRAGQGGWTACAAAVGAPAGMPPGALPPGAVPPGTQPPAAPAQPRPF